MIMLYANYIKGSAINYDRLIIKKDDIIKVTKQHENIVLNIKYDFAVELKENKNFSTVSGFFDYICDYSEIAFETKEIPTKREIKVGDIYKINDDIFFVVIADYSHYCFGTWKIMYFEKDVPCEKTELQNNEFIIDKTYVDSCANLTRELHDCTVTIHDIIYKDGIFEEKEQDR